MQADQHSGGRNKLVAAATRCWRGVASGERGTTLGSGVSTTLGGGGSVGGTLGGDVGCFGGRNNFVAFCKIRS